MCGITNILVQNADRIPVEQWDCARPNPNPNPNPNSLFLQPPLSDIAALSWSYDYNFLPLSLALALTLALIDMLSPLQRLTCSRL